MFQTLRFFIDCAQFALDMAKAKAVSVAPSGAVTKGFMVWGERGKTGKQQEKGATDKKRILGTTVALAVLAIFISSAQAAIKIEVAEVQNGFAFVKGNGAQKSSQITWDGNSVTTANKNNGGFSFSGAVPSDCIGELGDGVTTINVQLLGCTPVSQGGGVLKTGQTHFFATGDDGDYQAGVPVPSPRFTDNGDGTITDNLTGLTWLKDASCLGIQNWANALAAANALADGNLACGLADGSIAGDWRLPNRSELASLLDLGTSITPVLPAVNPFMNFVASFYWSSTTFASVTTLAWVVNFGNGFVTSGSKTSGNFVTAVRGGL